MADASESDLGTSDGRRPRVGVIAMQGAFVEHAAALERVGAEAVLVRSADLLPGLDGVVLPGGESTAIRMGLDRAGLLEPLRAAIAGGLPALGTCAGMIVLGHAPADAAPATFGLIDVHVDRNGFGRQVHSFEQDVAVTVDGVACDVPGVFIRAPRIVSVGDGVEVLGRVRGGEHDGEAVAVRQGTILCTSFHPELTDDVTLHRTFAGWCSGVHAGT